MPVSIFAALSSVGKAGVCTTHIKALKTATARGKMTTIAAVAAVVAVASTAVTPWLNLLFVLILL